MSSKSRSSRAERTRNRLSNYIVRKLEGQVRDGIRNNYHKTTFNLTFSCQTQTCNFSQIYEASLKYDTRLEFYSTHKISRPINGLEMDIDPSPTALETVSCRFVRLRLTYGMARAYTQNNCMIRHNFHIRPDSVKAQGTQHNRDKILRILNGISII